MLTYSQITTKLTCYCW